MCDECRGLGLRLLGLTEATGNTTATLARFSSRQPHSGGMPCLFADGSVHNLRSLVALLPALFGRIA
ncbi:MAG: H-X9-DG-CTERM domain-containing protein [Gemmataceae bacterium]